jgi:histone H3/H4
MKRKLHYFEVYIIRVLKECSDTNTISSIAKQQLNSFVCIFISRLCSDLVKLLGMVDKKICSIKEVITILSILLKGDLLTNCVSEGQKAVELFHAKKQDGGAAAEGGGGYVPKNSKAGILFPPNLVDKFLKKHHIVYSHVNHVSVFIAAVCEYIVHEILDTTIQMIEGHKKKVDVYDLKVAVDTDRELSALFDVLDVSFFIADIKSILFKTSFERLVRKYTGQAKVTKSSLDTLRVYIEKYVIDLLSDASMLAEHNKRGRVLPCDINLMYYLKSGKKERSNEERSSVSLLSL